MSALTPQTLAEICKELSTLHRAARIEANSDDVHAQAALVTPFVVGGAILMLTRAINGQANEWREFMYSIDGRLNQLHNAMLDMTQSMQQGVRVNDSEQEAQRMALQAALSAIRDEVAQIPGAISEVGTDIGAGIALAFEQALKTFSDDNTHNG